MILPEQPRSDRQRNIRAIFSAKYSQRNISHPAMQSPNLQTLSAVLKVAILSAVLSIAIKLAATGSIDAPPDWVAWLLILLPSALLAVWMWQQGPADRPHG